MSSKKIIKGISYGRVSTTEQAFFSDGTRKEDASPQVQKIRCQNFIDNLNQTDKENTRFIVEHISDDGFSGGNTNRPGYQKLIERIKKGEVKFIIATELTRLSRNTLDFLDFFNVCMKHSVDVIIIGLNLDTSTPIGKVIITILVALGEFERNITGERVRNNAFSRLVNDGKINGATEVLGLDKSSDKKGHFIINQEEVKILERIFEIFIFNSNKAETLREIHRQNIKWKRGAEFTKSNLEAVFKYVTDRYRGVWPINRTPDGIIQYVKLPHGPVVNSELLDKVEQKLNSIKPKKRQAGKNGHYYLLSTLLEYEDGTSFSGQPAKARQYRYYYNKEHKLRIRCDEIENKIFEQLENYLVNDESLKKLTEQMSVFFDDRVQDTKTKKAELEKELLELAEREGVIKDKVLNTQDFQSTNLIELFDKELSTISNRRDHLNSTLNELNSIQDKIFAPITANGFRKLIKTFIQEMKKRPNSSHRGLMESMFNKIVIKSTEEIELQMFSGFFEENKTSRSSSAGLNGGSNRT